MPFRGYALRFEKSRLIMYKYKIVLEYDGTNYRGWQTQKNAKSIQETLIAAAQKFLGGRCNFKEPDEPMPECMPWRKPPIWNLPRKLIRKLYASGSMITCRQALMYCRWKMPAAFSCSPSRREPKLSLSYRQKAHRLWQALCLVDQRQS